MRLADYLDYCENNSDPISMYAFEPEFAEICPQLLDDYEIPRYFKEDFLTVLGDEMRPPFRWFVIGPPKTGSPFHVDPMATSAW